MILLGSERAYRRWARDAYDTYNDRWQAESPKEYPCYAYTVVQSFGYEETAPRYLYASDIAKMHANIQRVATADAT